MKQEKNIEKLAESQKPDSIKDAYAATRVKLNQISMKVTATNGDFNIFLNQNLGKGPPGRTRSPVTAYCLSPDNQPIFLKTPLPEQSLPEPVEGQYNNEFKQFNNKQISNFYKHLIFKIMKKQILFLMVFVLAAFVSVTNSYGQTLAPRPVDVLCLPNDALHPIAGKPYDYTVTVPTPAAGVFNYTWYVTQDQNFIAAGVLTLAAAREAALGLHLSATGVGYNNIATGTPVLNLTWKAFVYDPAAPVFVVVQVNNTVGCTTNNLKVYRIEPVNAFTLDIANIAADKTTVAAVETSIDRCISPIVSATYDATAKDGIFYDFGVDYLYYIVTAANFSTSWLPQLKINAINASETVTAVEWFRPTDTGFATPVAMTLLTGVYTSASPVLVLDASGAVGSAGESIIIRITIDHTNGANQYEGITNETVTIAVDGTTQLALATPLGDVHFSSTVGSATAAADCGKIDLFRNDIATQVILQRPEVVTATPAVPGPGNGAFLPVK